jgi:hypothetical protein
MALRYGFVKCKVVSEPKFNGTQQRVPTDGLGNPAGDSHPVNDDPGSAANP